MFILRGCVKFNFKTVSVIQTQRLENVRQFIKYIELVISKSNSTNKIYKFLVL